MTTVITYNEKTKTFLAKSDLNGALVGGWSRYPFVPDRCENCRDENFQRLPATGYVTDAQGWRHGVCDRCAPKNGAITCQKTTHLERAVLLHMAVHKNRPDDEQIGLWRILLGVFADSIREE
jgi:hypothetical protein